MFKLSLATFSIKKIELYVANTIKERQIKFIEKYNMEIDTDPRIVQTFKMYNFVSSNSIII